MTYEKCLEAMTVTLQSHGQTDAKIVRHMNLKHASSKKEIKMTCNAVCPQATIYEKLAIHGVIYS